MSARVPFVQSVDWERRCGGAGRANGFHQDIYAENRCCYCGRLTRPDAARLTLVRDDSGGWWVAAPGAPLRADEHHMGGLFDLPIGPDCLKKHPEFNFGVVVEDSK